MRQWPLLLVAVLAVGCDSPHPTGSTDDIRSEEISPKDDPLQSISFGVAAAMSSQNNRDAVFSSMRESKVSQHVVDLHAFLSSRAGAGVASAVAEELSLSRDVLLRIVSSLPALDFYIPARAMRQSWERDGDVVVVADLKIDENSVGYSPSGAMVTTETLENETLFFIEGASRRAIRTDRDPGDGSVIQGPDEFTRSFTRYAPHGTPQPLGGPAMVPGNGGVDILLQ